MTTRGRKWREIRKHILDRDDNRCQYCGQIATQVDHVIPVAKGGQDTEDNLLASCAVLKLVNVLPDPVVCQMYPPASIVPSFL